MTRILVRSIQLGEEITERVNMCGDSEEVRRAIVTIVGTTDNAPFEIELPLDDLKDLMDAVVWNDLAQINLAVVLRDTVREELSRLHLSSGPR